MSFVADLWFYAVVVPAVLLTPIGQAWFYGGAYTGTFLTRVKLLRNGLLRN